MAKLSVERPPGHNHAISRNPAGKMLCNSEQQTVQTSFGYFLYQCVAPSYNLRKHHYRLVSKTSHLLDCRQDRLAIYGRGLGGQITAICKQYPLKNSQRKSIHRTWNVHSFLLHVLHSNRIKPVLVRACKNGTTKRSMRERKKHKKKQWRD